MTRKWLACLASIGVAAGTATALAAPLTTTFTYQGQLKSDGEPLNGAADFEFTLWDSAVGGNQVGELLTADNVSAFDGMFTVELDFGALAFNGQQRWLEIAVRSAGAGAFTTLSPRQPVTGAPYALQTRGIFVDDAGLVGVGTTEPTGTLSVGSWGVGDAGLNYIIPPPLLDQLPVEPIPAQLTLSGAFNTGANAAGVKLLIEAYDNDDTTASYPIIVRDENGQVDFYLRSRISESGAPWAYFDGGVGIGTLPPNAPGIHAVGLIQSDTGFRLPDGNLLTAALWGDNGAGDIHTMTTGNVGIGLTDPTEDLSVAGRIGAFSEGPANAGRIATYGPNGHLNFRATWLTGSPDHGHFGLYDADGEARLLGFVQSDGSGCLRVRAADGANNVELRGGSTAVDSHPYLRVSGSTSNSVALFRNENPDGQGVTVQIMNPETSRANNFVTFLDGDGQVTGRIEGFDLQAGDWQPPPAFFDSLDPEIDVNFSPGSLPSLTWNGFPDPPTFHGGSLPSFGNPPIEISGLPSPNQWTLLVNWAVRNNLMSLITIDPFSMAAASAKIAATQAVLDGGVVYGSKGADYAEYLPKLNPDDKFQLGQIVGVHDGKISLATKGADQIMAISSMPVVLGNQPQQADAEDYEPVAFMGQVMVLVRGTVEPGDYILPSGLEDGTGVAVAPDQLSAAHLGRVLGRAWTASTSDVYSLVTVAVGLNTHAEATIIRNQAAELEALGSDLDALRGEMAALRAGVAELQETGAR